MNASRPVVAIGHFDHGGNDVRAAMDAMVEAAVLAANTNDDTTRAATWPTHLAWYLVGSMVDPEHSSETLATVLSHLATIVVSRKTDGVTHELRPDGVAFWTWNTTIVPRSSLPPNVSVKRSHVTAGGVLANRWHGLIIDVSTGACRAATVKPGTRKYPLAPLRRLVEHAVSFLFPLPRERQMEVCTDVDNAAVAEVLSLPLRPTAAGTVQKCVTFATVVWSMRRAADTQKPMPVMVRPYGWSRFHPATGNMSDTELLRCSTSPHCEPTDFASEMRARIPPPLRISNAAAIFTRRQCSFFFGEFQVPAGDAA